MESKTYEVLVYEKSFKTKTGKTFKAKRFKVKEHVFEGFFTDECNTKLSKTMAVNSLQYPIVLTLAEDNYFVKKIFYTKKDGTEGHYYRIVVSDFIEAKQAEFKKTTLDELE